MREFNLKQRRILYQLDLDCRQSNSEIARKVGLSKQVVDYQIKRLEEEGYIERFASVIDTYRLGYSKYKLYLSLQNADSKKIREIIAFFVEHKKTEWIASCSGKYDVIAGLLVKNVYEFNEVLKEFNEKHSEFVAEKETAISLGVPHWRKEYLLENKKTAPVVYQGGVPQETNIDETEEQLVQILVNNARMPIIEIAQRLETTPRIVQYHLKKLREKKVLLISRFFLNLKKLDWIYVKAILNFKNLSKERYSAFITYCDQIKNLTYLINCIGGWDVELDFEIENFNKFNNMMLDLRDKFSDIIKKYDFVIIQKEEKLDYYPGSKPQYKKRKEPLPKRT